MRILITATTDPSLPRLLLPVRSNGWQVTLAGEADVDEVVGLTKGGSLDVGIREPVALPGHRNPTTPFATATALVGL